MKVAVNRCWGGFGISHDGLMRYADLSGFKLYAYVHPRESGNLQIDRLVPYTDKESALFVSYLRNPTNPDGTYNQEDFFSERDIARNDPILIQVIEEMGKSANGQFSEIEIVDIPDDVKWEIDDYDGMESVQEVHRSW